MPVTDIIEMVAGLLTKIAATNDRHHSHLQRQIQPYGGVSSLSQQTTSILAFHGKNVPSISILNYLGRIHKYCPTTYEVFLSLLVYFDRMTERINAGCISSLLKSSDAISADQSVPSSVTAGFEARNPSNLVSVRSAATSVSGFLSVSTAASPQSPKTESISISDDNFDNHEMSHFFVDSFNIHRLVIAGVTCASKFFSDVFYTNSRYAKVGGLPLVELNHLELQFLLLNDFRLAVSFEEIQAYGTMLVEFYAQEVAKQHRNLSDIKDSED